MNNINQIAISGAIKTGKTTLCRALSHLTGVPYVHASSVKEIASEIFPGKKVSELGAWQLMSVGLARYTERAGNEAVCKDGFISDGSVLNEWIYGLARLKIGLNPDKKINLKYAIMKIIKPIISFNLKIANGYGIILKEHSRNNYHSFIHLDINDNYTSEFSDKTKRFRKEYDRLFLQHLKEINVPYYIVSGTLEQRLQRIIELFNIKPVMTIAEAIHLATEESANQPVEYHYGM